MRDPKRIEKILKNIKIIWKRNPNLRLGQLLQNCFGLKKDIYHIEDEDLIVLLKQTYKKG